MQKPFNRLPVVPKHVYILIMLGLASLLFYSTWWLQADRLSSPWLLFALLAAIMYASVQIIGSWLLYMAAYHADRRRL